MLRLSRRSFVCWSCLLRNADVSVDRVPRRCRLLKTSTRWPSSREYSSAASALAPGKSKEEKNRPAPSEDDAVHSGISEPGKSRPIRERLRQWSLENEGFNAATVPLDASIFGDITNLISRTQSTASSELDQLRPSSTGMTDGSSSSSSSSKWEPTNYDAEQSVVGSDSRNPGDLVEMRHVGSRVPVFAIYLGYFGDRNHFYAANGKWITSVGYSSLFTVSNFVTLQDLEPVLATIPRDATPERFEELRRDEKGPTREAGVALIKKMKAFTLDAEAIYQANMTRLDGAQNLLADRTEVRYLSLFEIADLLLPASLKRDHGFTNPALYAVHRALSRNDVGFCPLSPSADCHRRDHLFEVFPQNHAKLVSEVISWVRQYTAYCAKKLRSPSPSELEDLRLGKFILQARDAVTKSRQSREWTPHGILKTSSSVTLPKVDWSPVSRDVITFLEWWASYNLFGAGSRYHAYGALILRSLSLYDDAALDQSTAWSFLQEIGVIAPWEIPSRYRVRFPGTTITRGGGINRPIPQHLESSLRSDIAEGCRTLRSGSTIFCIDAPSTVVIDDGISLQRTERDDEFWIHVHVADPASVIEPGSELSNFLELVPETIYLPGHYEAMMPSELGGKDGQEGMSESLVGKHSLQAGAPALTFSAKVNEGGDILDWRIEPSTLENVAYLDPQDVATFCGEQMMPPPPSNEDMAFSVGTLPDAHHLKGEQRLLMSAQDLDEPGKSDLLTLHRLAEALKRRRVGKGAWPHFFPRPAVQVSFHESSIPEVDGTDGGGSGTQLLPPDPYIEVGAEASSSGCSVVSNTMVLAGEVAARWCSSRGIPLPYRKDARSAENFEAAFAYATKEIYPLIRRGIEPRAGHRQELLQLTGGPQLSTKPGPYFLMGLDMYAKATSPLRRFSDLLLHWQVHAALAHERKTQRAMDPAVDDVDKVVPFSAASLESQTLPLLQMRERMARMVGRGTLDWILIALVRAWRFEDKALRRLRFTVGSRWRQGILGHLDLLGLNATMDIAGINGCRLVKDIQTGDEFEVELVDVNVHSRQILVKALRRLGEPEGEARTTRPAPAVQG